MGVVEDEIDPSWWEQALDSASTLGHYTLPELLFQRLAQAAADPSVSGTRKAALQVLAKVSCPMLVAENWSEPFTPKEVMDALSEEELALLARIAPLIGRDDLRARVADVAWCYGNRSDVAMLDRAIDAYRATPLSGDEWSLAGSHTWVRALELAARRGSEGVSRLMEMSSALKAEVLAGQVRDRFRIVQLAETLRRYGRHDRADATQVAEALFALAAQAAAEEPRLARDQEREAIAWLKGSDRAAVHAATERIARSCIAEAKTRISEEPESGALAQSLLLEEAINELRTLPRSYRSQHGLDELIDDLRVQLRESRESSMEQLVRIQSNPVDLTDAVAASRARVSGHADRLVALAAFVTLTPAMDEASTRENAAKAVNGSLRHLFPSATLSSDSRKVAVSDGSFSDSGDDMVWAEMVRSVAIHFELLGPVIQGAQELLTTEHRFSRSFLASLCAESPAVPMGHEEVWAAGLTLGLSGNHGAAIAVLVPQLEHAVRTVLKRRDVHTLFVDKNGVEIEKGLETLLDLPEAADTFGAGSIMEMKAMTVDPRGPNLRHAIAHGLFDDRVAWSYSAITMWWFCLRLVVAPLLHMMSRTEAADSS